MSDAVERRIREAIERGDFDDLPGTGAPLAGLEQPYRPDWWARAWVERERSADRRAESIEEIERTARRLWAAPDLTRLHEIMDDIDVARREAGLDPLDRDAAVTMWKSVRRHRA